MAPSPLARRAGLILAGLVTGGVLAFSGGFLAGYDHGSKLDPMAVDGPRPTEPASTEPDSDGFSAHAAVPPEPAYPPVPAPPPRAAFMVPPAPAPVASPTAPPVAASPVAKPVPSADVVPRSAPAAYTLQVAAFSDPDRARREIARLETLGLAPRLGPDGGDGWWRVFVGGHATKADARAEAERLADAFGLASLVKRTR